MSIRTSLRILADENIGARVVEALRSAGYDVVSVKEQFPGIRDTDVLRIAHEEQRLIITQDKDFGELAVRLGLPASSGVLLIRIDRGLPHDDAERIVAVVRSRADWSGHFSVVDDERIRMRPLPRKSL
ncbi:MAG: hypothetical protein C7B45_09315 [Sulfobacillus acidophilus]|uniref:DUF5615 domain-containing protein n=1 Tax=Sulfobacillus acidophilus TaxID=53633 RepID=A0A2T2WHS6_9FIRM|nr:MAG: hypothetical protein C7B45_09315 [Sulfobacillus acidophilus]